MLKKKESDLYPAIKKHLESLKFEVKGEINNCDIVAKKDEHIIIVEMKLSLNITLLLQAVDRFNLTDTVYIAIPKQCGIYKKQSKQVKKLIKRLGIGLIVVDIQKKQHYVEVISDPQEYIPRINKPKQKSLLREFSQRLGDPQKGGATRQKAGLTAYRQRCIRVAEYLIKKESASGAEIKGAIGEDSSTQFLSNNYYGWFEKIDRGVYRVSQKGKEELPNWTNKQQNQ